MIWQQLRLNSTPNFKNVKIWKIRSFRWGQRIKSLPWVGVFSLQGEFDRGSRKLTGSWWKRGVSRQKCWQKTRDWQKKSKSFRRSCRLHAPSSRQALFQLGKRMEEHLELLKQIESTKGIKKDASKRNKGQMTAFENGRMAYKKIAEEIAALGQRYDAATAELRTVERNVNPHSLRLRLCGFYRWRR